MTMTPENIHQAAQDLHQAWLSRTTIPPLSKRYSDISMDDAYQIQTLFVDAMKAGKHQVIGKKVGVTSQAVMDLLGVYQPDFGYLLDNMCAQNRQAIQLDTLIQPKAEGEIAFVLKDDLMGPGITNADVLAATRGVMPCFEIVDSRITDWKIAITDTVADNASCGLFVLGDQLTSAEGLDLALAGMVLEKNGQIVATGAGAAALGSPVNAVTWLANTLGQFGIPLKAGEVILSGSLATMVPVQPGDFLKVSIAGLGSCSVCFE
ncbi:2-oxopent-4-enoate hydratase [Candidatus Thalassolituus haligoni]|uniref:2-oxopent-4-enoate hydratase n=1 Tax=Candidatus Thalassolituus haligoni TaxID=3100113 RepID=UPI003511CB42|tara:strand:- start:10671 stop:11459 length:789 start_codon:yes stop_codon:yes gene_type:complete